MDTDAGKDLCNKIDSCIFSFAYGIAFEALVVTVVCIILFFCGSCLFCSVSYICGNLDFSIFLSHTEETACCAFAYYFDLSVFFAASELFESCCYCFIYCCCCLCYCLFHIENLRERVDYLLFFFFLLLPVLPSPAAATSTAGFFLNTASFLASSSAFFFS